eukprot:216724-Chlamydomonas_euryale.AAC.7
MHRVVANSSTALPLSPGGAERMKSGSEVLGSLVIIGLRLVIALERSGARVAIAICIFLLNAGRHADEDRPVMHGLAFMPVTCIVYHVTGGYLRLCAWSCGIQRPLEMLASPEVRFSVPHS